MVTTAARSRDYMRKLGYIAECVEHRRGQFIRVDLFGFADVLAYGKDKILGSKIILIQAYHKKEKKGHAHLNSKDNNKIAAWLDAGGEFEHHLWSFKTKKGRKFWDVERLFFQ